MPRRDLYEASLERCDYDNRFRLRFVSDWARFSGYLELDGRALRAVSEQGLLDLYRHSYGRAVDGLFAAGLTPEEANETLHRISARLDDEVARMLERCRITHDWPAQSSMNLVSARDRTMVLQFILDQQQINLSDPMAESHTQKALEKSKQLLIRNLTSAQRQEFERNPHFNVKVRDRTLQIDTRSTFNVTDLATGVRYCTRSAEPVPIYDLMLAQKLMLEVDPDSFFAVANDDTLRPAVPWIWPRPRQRVDNETWW